MMSRGNGEAPRQEPKKRKSKSKGKQKSGGGGFAGWRKPSHPALAKVNQSLLRRLHRWSVRKTFTHQFQTAATPSAPATPPAQIPATKPQKPKAVPAGLAAVKHAQRLEATAALQAAARQEGQKATGRGSTPSGLGELYEFHKRNGTLAVFFSLYPPAP